MITNHDEIEELLAGYALQSLSGEDAKEADGLLVEHVPGCDSCRDLLADLQAVSGDLALAADPVRPPDLLLPRIRKSMKERPVREKRRWAAVLVAASAVAIFALAGWNVVLSGQLSEGQTDNRQLTSLVKGVLEEDGSQMVSLRNPQEEPTMLAAYLPELPHTRILGANVPMPTPGNLYRLWVLDDGVWTIVADFVPADGYVEIDVPMDLSRYEQLIVTEETGSPPASATSSAPTGDSRWSAAVDERI